MNNFLKILCIWVVVPSMLLSTSVHANISTIPKWEEYQLRIDNFFNKRSSDEVLLSKIKNKLLSIEVSQTQTAENKRYIAILIDYMIEVINGHLADITSEVSSKQDIELPVEQPSIAEPVVVSAPRIEAPKQLNLEGFEDNPRTILAGSSAAIYEVDVVSNLEPIEVGEVVFTLRAPNAELAESTIKNASIYVWGFLIDTNSNSDIRIDSSGRFRIEFRDISNLIIQEQEEEMHLVLHTQEIGFQRIGQTFQDFFVESVSFADGEWQTSNQDVSLATINERGNTYSILPGRIIPMLQRGLESSLATKFDLKLDVGTNASTTTNSTPNAVLESIIFNINGSNFGDNSPTFTLENTDNSGDVVQWVLNGNILTFDASQFSHSSRTINGNTTEEYEMTIGGISSNASIFLDLESDGVIYSIVNVEDSEDLQIDLRQDISLGSRIIR